jgi:hypothetical protein
MDEVIKKKIIQERNRNKELQNQLKNLETKVTEKLKPVVQLTQKIARRKQKDFKTFGGRFRKEPRDILKVKSFCTICC